MTEEIKSLLNQKYKEYNTPNFVVSDPISIPHMFTKKEDIEISAFLTSIIAWGRRTAIIKSAKQLMELMENSPHDFLINSYDKDFKRFHKFVYRTFNPDDCLFLIAALKNVYENHGGLEYVAQKSYGINHDIKDSIIGIRETLFSTPHLRRSEKHVANPHSGSAAKRVNMFLRWMIRKDEHGVDFGIWENISQSHLMCPLDVHSGNVARKLGLLSRKQNDWKAVQELTNNLKVMDSNDPVKYDFALFGMGVFEGIS